WAEVGARPWERLALRAGADREGHRIEDRLSAGGTGEIATVDLLLERFRLFWGADWYVGPRDRLRLRHVISRLSAATRADELETQAARAFLHVDTDLGLLLEGDRKSTRLNSSHVKISYAGFCLKKKEIQ